MYTISKEFAFDAAHHLPEMPDGHKCKRPHGHTYRVVVELEAPTLDGYGFVRDYGELADIKRFIDDTLDHRDLTAIVPEFTHGEFGARFTGPNPRKNTTTAERLAHWLYEVFRSMHNDVVAVTVCETPKTAATYRPAR